MAIITLMWYMDLRTCNCMLGFIQDFLLEGGIIAHGNVHKLGGSGGMLPLEILGIYDLLDCF